MNRMIVANLVHRPLRSIISIIAVAVEVTLILLIVGLALGMLDDNKQRQKGTGADIIVRPPGSSVLVGMSGSPMSEKYADLLRQQPHVVAVAPVAAQFNVGTNVEVIYGIDPASFESVGGPFRYLQGAAMQGPNDVLVDDYFASANHVDAGSTIEVLNHKFRVAGVVEHGRGGRRFIPIRTMQDLTTGGEKKVSMFYVKLDNPDQAEAAVQELKNTVVFKEFNIMSMREWLSLMTPEHVPGLSSFIKVVVGISVIIGFIVIFQSMYTAVMERTREIGILKSLGASKSYIVRVILRETLLLSVAGIIVGILVSLAALPWLHYKFPTLRVDFTIGWMVKATIIAILGSMMGAIYPAFKAAQKDPIDALAYE